MIDPLDIVRAVSTLTAATVVGCGVLNWYTRDAHRGLREDGADATRSQALARIVGQRFVPQGRVSL